MSFEPYIIGITGGSGSGKTYFINTLKSRIPDLDISFISLDDYYKPKEEQNKDENGIENFDTPESIDFDRFFKDLTDLKNGKEIRIKEYNFNNPNSNTTSFLTIQPAKIIVIEGIFTFYFKKIRNICNLKLFIDARESIKFRRRIERDQKERGYDLDDIFYRYEHHILNSYDQFVEPYKFEADFIINNHRVLNNEAVKVLINHIESILKIDVK